MKTKAEFQILLGNNLRRIRTSKNWTIEKLAIESGLPYSQVSRLELGKRNPTAYTIYQITRTLDTNPSEFFVIKDIT